MYATKKAVVTVGIIASAALVASTWSIIFRGVEIAKLEELNVALNDVKRLFREAKETIAFAEIIERFDEGE